MLHIALTASKRFIVTLMYISLLVSLQHLLLFLGMYIYHSDEVIRTCCLALEQHTDSGFISNLKATFRNFAVSIKKMPAAL
jgi:hypothetical protein